jgi:hypothetical protein
MKKRILIIAIALFMCVVMLSSCDQISTILGDIAEGADVEANISDILSMLFGNGQSSGEDENEYDVFVYEFDNRSGKRRPLTDGVLFENVLWEPGLVLRADLMVENEGVLVCNYDMYLTATGEEDSSKPDITKVIDVFFCYPDTELERADLDTDSEYYAGTLYEILERSVDGGVIFPEETRCKSIVLKMREDASVKYYGATPGDIGVRLLVSPIEEEKDPFGDPYDYN